MQRAGHPGPSLKCTGGRVMGMQFKQWLISVFSLACPAMHNRQSALSHTGVATNGQLLIIVLLNTQFSQPGTDCSAGAIIMVKNKAKQCYVSEKKRERGRERGDNKGWEEACIECISAHRDGTEEKNRREERALVTKQREEGRNRSKMPKLNQRKKKMTGLSESCREKGRMRERKEVKWSRAIREIEGMKVRDGEHKIMEGGREIEKGTLGSRSKSV